MPGRQLNNLHVFDMVSKQCWAAPFACLAVESFPLGTTGAKGVDARRDNVALQWPANVSLPLHTLYLLLSAA